MQMNMNVSGVKPVQPLSTRAETLAIERLRKANLRLQSSLNAANAKTSHIQQTEMDLARVNAELAKARKTISELNAKVKTLTAKVAESLKQREKEQKEEERKYFKPDEIKIVVSDAKD